MKTRIHKEEMIRFAKSEEGTTIWYRRGTSDSWRLIKDPLWREDCVYVVNNKYAELRKKSIDEGRAIQMYNLISSKWETPIFELEFNSDIKSYRLEPKEDKFKYPIYKKNKTTGFVVEFTSKAEGRIVLDTEDSRHTGHYVGHESDKWKEHTNTEVWEDCEYEEPTYYYRWEKLTSKGSSILKSSHVTDEYAEKNSFENSGWRKLANTKRTWED